METPISMNAEEQSRVQLTELILAHRISVYGFILAQVPDTHAAEDIFQDVCLVISEKWDTFDPQYSFRAWAFGIARNKVLQYFDRQRRSKTVLLDEELLDQVAASSSWEADDLAEKEALRECLMKLTAKVRNMLKLRYFENLTPKAMSERLGWGARSISVALSRARNALLQCVDMRLSSQARN